MTPHYENPLTPSAVVQTWRDRDGSVRVGLLNTDVWDCTGPPAHWAGAYYHMAILRLTPAQAAALHRYLGETLAATKPKEA